MFKGAILPVVCFILFPITVAPIMGFVIWEGVIPLHILVMFACLVEAITIAGAWIVAWLFNI